MTVLLWRSEPDERRLSPGDTGPRGRGEGHERRFVNDALIFLQARQLGASVLTGNVRDFDFLSQIVPSARVILYRVPL
ncbi:hypothetical protein FHT87_001634 [Rhizobium sp. BK316]|uniref:hypothetical protein n=1 Tax=Rhizobium sp. BK316 TaxID=2587053 RepID=UPI00161E0D93|nr:hypothetical protein [Rhizobium sp. BK316]MBB3407734.1 hypothetical protein [Rhizobium sp. BK316]